MSEPKIKKAKYSHGNLVTQLLRETKRPFTTPADDDVATNHLADDDDAEGGPVPAAAVGISKTTRWKGRSRVDSDQGSTPLKKRDYPGHSSDNSFIKEINKFVFGRRKVADIPALVKLRRVVVDSNKIGDVTMWHIPPLNKIAARDYWTKMFGHPPPGGKWTADSVILNKLSMRDQPDFVSRTVSCKVGSRSTWTGCFIAAFDENVNSVEEAQRVLPAVHNVTVVATVTASSRAALWRDLRTVLRKKKFPSDWWDAVVASNSYLSDADMSMRRMAINNARSSDKQSKRTVIQHGHIVRFLHRGNKRFFIDKDWNPARDWAEAAVWLLMACGARKVELLHYSRFRPITDEETTRVMDVGKRIPAGGFDNKFWIRQVGLAKKKESSLVPPEMGASLIPDVIKPLIGGITATAFIDVWIQVRAAFTVKITKVLNKDWDTITKREAGDYAATPMRDAFIKSFKNFKLMRNFITGEAFHLHTLRAIYGVTSFMDFDSDNGSLPIWVGRVLGHDVTDHNTARFYTTISVVRGAMGSDAKPAAQFSSLIARLEEKEQKLDSLLQKWESVTSNKGGETQTSDIMNDDGDMVSIARLSKFPTRALREAAEEKKIEEMQEHCVAFTHKNMRALGFGSQFIMDYRKKHNLIKK